jgi:hypothetical protein
MSARALVAVALVAGVAGCPRPPRPAEIDDLDVSEKAERWYRLSWRGDAVGWAVERETTHKITRVEHLEIQRGDVAVTTELEITIAVEADLTPKQLRVTSRENGKQTSTVADRRPDGWHRDGDPGTFAPADAVPAELVPALVRIHGNFAGAVILSGWDLAVGDGVVVAAGDRRVAARTVVGDRAIDAAVELDLRGNTARVIDSTGTEAVRVERDTATAPWQAIDVIAAGSIELADRDVPIELTLRPRGRTPAPPALPGQRVVADAGRWQVTIDPALPGALAPGPPATSTADAEIAEISTGVHEAITPSLAGNSATAGDCTAYAVAFAAYARMAGIPAQVVTGFLVDGDRMVRHRWNLAWTGARWVTVDASQKEPTPRLGIAVSDDSIAGLTAASMFDVVP